MFDRVKKNDLQTAFAGKTAIVTGATTGIGRGLCEAMGQLGTRVVVTGRDLSKAEAVASDIGRTGGLAEAMHLDVTQDEEFAQVIDQVVSDHGGLDYLFNNAGILVAGDVRLVTADDWDRVLAVNLRGAITGTRLAYEVMSDQGSGHIVNLSSSAGLFPSPLFTPYATMKHGIVGLSTSLRLEAQHQGVKVSVVCPGFVKSEIFDKGSYGGNGRSAVEKLMPFKVWETERGVDLILREVARNKAIIAFPSYIQFFWRLYRYFPDLYCFMARYTTAPE